MRGVVFQKRGTGHTRKRENCQRMTENHCRNKDLLLLSSTFLIEDPASLLCSFVKTQDTGFPITTVGNDKSGHFHTNPPCRRTACTPRDGK